MNYYLIGRELIVCQSAKDHFNEILDTIGGPGERKRGEELLNKSTIVPDDMVLSVTN